MLSLPALPWFRFRHRLSSLTRARAGCRGPASAVGRDRTALPPGARAGDPELYSGRGTDSPDYAARAEPLGSRPPGIRHGRIVACGAGATRLASRAGQRGGARLGGVNPDAEKQAAAQAAAAFVEDGMLVGLGTGSTVGHLLPILAARRLSIRCVATSPRTQEAARRLGLVVEPFAAIDRLDVTIDGADQIAPGGWLVKGGGAAHTREKIVAAAADRFVVIADSTKAVRVLHPPIPVELAEFGLRATLRRLDPVTLRDVPRSPDGGVIADYGGDFGDPAGLAARLSATPGLVEHGLFPPDLVSVILIAHGDEIEQSIPG